MTKIIQRHDTAANWTTINPILASGEIGVETDTNKFKFGDGTTAWADLAYAAGEGGGSGSGTTLTSTDGTTTYSKLALGDTLSVTDTTVKELNKLTQTGGTLNSELEFTGASGASLKMTEKYSLSTADYWEFQIKYKHNGGGSSPTIFGYASGSDYKTPVFIYEKGSLGLYLSSSGSSWNLSNTGSGLAPVVGTIYYFKVGFTGNQYYIKYNTTGWSDEFTTQWTFNSTTKTYCSDYFMFMNLSLADRFYNTGTMYLQDTALFINGSEVWRGANVIPGFNTLNANLNELDNEVNTLSSRVSANETSITELQDKKQDVLTGTDTVSITQESIRFDLIQTGTRIVKNADGSYSSTLTTGAQTNYLMVSPKLDFFYSNDWELILPFRADDLSHYLSLFAAKNGDGPSCSYEGNLRVWYGPNRPAYPSGFSLTAGTKTWLKCKYINSTFTVYKSTDGINYTQQYSYNPGGTPTSDLSKDWYFFGAPNSVVSWMPDNYAFTGTIYLNEIKIYKEGKLITNGLPNTIIKNNISANTATSSSLGVVQPDGTSITVNEAGVISGQDIKTFTGYSDTGTLVLKSINGVLQWVAEG